MSSNKCVAAVNVPVCKALSANIDDEFLYYIMEEKYDCKGKIKTRRPSSAY